FSAHVGPKVWIFAPRAVCYRKSSRASKSRTPLLLRSCASPGRPKRRDLGLAEFQWQMLDFVGRWGTASMEDAPSSHALLRSGDFEFDQDAGELRKDGARIRLQEQPLQILRILLEQPGKVIAREELRRKVWPSDTFVDFDHGINNAIKRLREALGDTAETP